MTSTKPSTITAPEGALYFDVVREFDAPPERVCEAFTNPELVVRWLGPRRYQMRLKEWDARDGGAWAYDHVDADGTAYGFRGVFHSIEPGRRIIQTFEWLGLPGHVSLETADFHAIDGGRRTRVVSRSVFQSLEDRDGMLAAGMEGGMNESYERLDALLAEG